MLHYLRASALGLAKGERGGAFRPRGVLGGGGGGQVELYDVDWRVRGHNAIHAHPEMANRWTIRLCSTVRGNGCRTTGYGCNRKMGRSTARIFVKFGTGGVALCYILYTCSGFGCNGTSVTGTALRNAAIRRASQDKTLNVCRIDQTFL